MAAVSGSRHQRITPYTPRHNGKVERYNRILSEEFLYARTWTAEHERAEALRTWNLHYNYHRPHSAYDKQPPASQTPLGVNNVRAAYDWGASGRCFELLCAGERHVTRVTGFNGAGCAIAAVLRRRARG